MMRHVPSVLVGVILISMLIQPCGTVEAASSSPSVLPFPPDNPGVQMVAAGETRTCVLRRDGTVICWGLNNNRDIDPDPDLRLISIDGKANHTCGLKSDLTVACWGYNYIGEATPPQGTFLQVDIGVYHTCGVRTDGTAACWGYNEYGQSTPPRGKFIQVAAEWMTTCAIRSDQTIACWGLDDIYGGRRPPSGKFEQITGGSGHFCAIRSDHTVACWGWNDNGQATPPEGTFKQISAGGFFTCGIRTDDTVTCWGWARDGMIDAPSGTFEQVSTGYLHNCGVRTDHSLVCWGDNTYHVAPQPVFQFSPAELPTANIYNPYLARIVVSGGFKEPYALEISSGGLPPGMFLTPSGYLTGNPAAKGSYTFTIRAYDSVGFSGTREYTLNVGNACACDDPVFLPLVITGEQTLMR